MSDADRAVVMMLHDNAALIDKCERLQAENDKLVMKLNAEHLVRQNVERENAKLRELVRDMWEDVCNAPCCAYCDHSDYDGDKCELRDRMRELGVEV